MRIRPMPSSASLLTFAISAVWCTNVALAAAVGEEDVRQCARELFQRVAGGQCGNVFSLETVRKVDSREAASEANVIADIEFRVKQQVGGTSQATTECTGNAWRVEVKNPYPPNTGQWFMYQSQADMSGGYLEPGRGLRVRKNFKFEKWESGWRCAEQSMRPLMLVWDNVNVTPPQQSVGSAGTSSRSGLCVVRGGATDLVTEPFPMGGVSDGKRIGEEFKMAHCIDNPELKCPCYLSNPSDNTTLTKMRSGILTRGGKSLEWKPGGR